jgi:histidine ammonia-lyase
VVALAARLGAVELAVAAQAAELRGLEPLGSGTGRALRKVRESVPFVGAGEAFTNDVDAVWEWVAAGCP